MGVKERIGAFFGKIGGNLPDEGREGLLRGERWVGEPPKQGRTPPRGSDEIKPDRWPPGADMDWS